MARRPARWHPDSPAHGGPPRGGGPNRAGHLTVLLIIVGCVLLIGVTAPSIRFESVLALLGFR